jgi:hypothetical protein
MAIAAPLWVPRIDAGYDAVLLPAGEAVLRRMWPVYASELERCFATVLDDQEAETIRDALRRVSEAVRAEQPALARAS